MVEIFILVIIVCRVFSILVDISTDVRRYRNLPLKFLFHSYPLKYTFRHNVKLVIWRRRATDFIVSKKNLIIKLIRGNMGDNYFVYHIITLYFHSRLMWKYIGIPQRYSYMHYYSIICLYFSHWMILP